jgi:hypothetical protein
MEAEEAVTLLPVPDQDPIRYQVARNLERPIHQTNRQPHNIVHAHRQKQVQNRTQEKLKNNNAIITKADKRNFIVILKKGEYNSKVLTFLTNKSFQAKPQDSTKRFQAEIRKDINSCTLIIPTGRRWTYVNLNPIPQNLSALTLLHQVQPTAITSSNIQNAVCAATLED